MNLRRKHIRKIVFNLLKQMESEISELNRLNLVFEQKNDFYMASAETFSDGYQQIIFSPSGMLGDGIRTEYEVKMITIHEACHLIHDARYPNKSDDIRSFYDSHGDDWSDIFREYGLKYGLDMDDIETEIEFSKKTDKNPRWINFLDEEVRISKLYGTPFKFVDDEYWCILNEISISRNP